MTYLASSAPSLLVPRFLYLPLLPLPFLRFHHPALPMPSYYAQDCHYFYRTALRLLSIPTSVAPRPS